MTATELNHAASERTGPAVSMRMIELVLKTGAFDRLRDWYTLLLDSGPFLEREPDRPPLPGVAQRRDRCCRGHPGGFTLLVRSCLLIRQVRLHDNENSFSL